MKGLSGRIGIDSTAGNWNAPIDLTTGWFQPQKPELLEKNNE